MAKFQEIESAVVSLDKQVKVLTADLQKLVTTVNSNSKGQKDLANKTNTVTKAVNQVSVVEKELERIRKAGLKVTKETVAAKEKLRQKTKALTDAERKANGTLKKSGGLFRSMTKSIIAAGAAMLTMRAAFLVIKNGFKTIVQFEKGMSAVRAITGATVKEFKALQSNALKLGATTAKTAIEVAGLQKEFAKLGFSTAEILAATEATINLSIAAESDLAEAAVVAASTIRGFGLSATESTRVTDVMAKSFTTTGLNLEKFKVAMANAQVAAKATGQTLEFTAAALGAIVDTGTDASKAGTDLRNIFAELAKQGLTLEDAYAKVNSSSNKVVTAMDLVGKRAFSSLITLAENTEKVDELTEAYVNSAGAAKAMADIMADNLAGDIVLAGSAWDGFILSLNSGTGTISKALRKITSTFTDFFNIITKINDGEAIGVQKLKNEIDFEGRLALVKEKSLKLITDRAEKEGKSRTEVAQALVIELEARSKSADLYLEELEASNELAKGNATNAQLGKEIVEGATQAQIAAAQVNADLKRESVIIVQNALAAEIAAEEAAVKAAQDASDKKKAIAIEESAVLEKIINDKDAEILARTEKIIAERQAESDRLVDEEIKLSEEELDRLAKQLDDEYALQVEAAQKEIDLAEDKEEAIKELKVAAIDASGKIVSDRLTAGIDEDLAKFQAGQDAEQKILDDQLDKKEISEEEFEKKSAALEKKGRIESAKAAKKKAAYDNIIDTLAAIGKTFAELGWPAGIIPAGVMGGIGLANGIAISAEPIPKFKYGSNGELQLDTTAIVGDGGKPELITTPKGDFLSPSTDTMVHLPRGSQVFGGDSPETQAALSGGMSDEHYNGLIAEQRLTRKAISNQPKSVTKLTDKGLEKAYITKQNKINFRDEWCRL